MTNAWNSGRSTGPAEFLLAVECCARSFRHGSPLPLEVPQTVNWQHFLRIVRFHRIEGLVWNGIASQQSIFPDELRNELRRAAAEIAAINLRVAQESRVLLQAFKHAEAPVLFLKGLPLGTLVYGTPAIKTSIDIDLLIDPDQLHDAATVLRRCNYRLVAPCDSAGDQLLQSWHRLWKESVWRNEMTRTQIDLHTRTADNPRLISPITVRSRQQVVSVAEDVTLPTLAHEEMFAYLAVHGSSSAWFRLKWISDFAGFLSGLEPHAVDRLYRCSQALGAGRAAGQALRLANELFGTLRNNPDLSREFDRDRSIARLYRTALQLLTRDPVEPTASRLGTFPIRASQLLLLPGLSYKMSEVSRQSRQLFQRPPA